MEPRPGSLGQPIPGHVGAIVDDAGNELPAGEVGQIAFRRPDPVMLLEYWRDPEATARKFVNGWLVTGYPWYGIQTPEHKAFFLAYHRKYNDYPRLGSVVGYSAIQSVAYGDNWVKPTQPGPVDRGLGMFTGTGARASASGRRKRHSRWLSPTRASSTSPPWPRTMPLARPRAPLPAAWSASDCPATKMQEPPGP